MSTYAVYAERFVLPSSLVGPGYLLVDDGMFAGFTTEKPEGTILDYSGHWIAPGLVDTHIHGFFNHATTDIDPAGIQEASLELARRGTTAWLPTTFTESPQSIASACAAIAEADKTRLEDFCGAHIAGIFLEGPFFTLKHVGAQNPDFLIDPDIEVFNTWQQQAEGRIVKSALAPERDGACEYISEVDAQGVVACIAHTDATYDEALAAVQAGAKCFIHTYNGMRGLHHRDPGVVGCAMTTPDTYAEVICDGHHVHKAAVDALIRAKGWDHVVLVTDCLACGGLPEGEYMSGGMEVEMRGGVCYLRGKENLAGSVATLAGVVKQVFDWGLVTAEQALRMGSEVAAKSARIEERFGYIAPGRTADFIVVTPELELKDTFVCGRRVS